MGWMGRGADVAGIAALVGPDNYFPGFDSQITGLKTGGGDGDGVLVHCLGSSLGIVGGAIGGSTFLHEVEIINSGVNKTADDDVNNHPLP